MKTWSFQLLETQNGKQTKRSKSCHKHGADVFILIHSSQAFSFSTAQNHRKETYSNDSVRADWAIEIVAKCSTECLCWSLNYCYCYWSCNIPLDVWSMCAEESGRKAKKGLKTFRQIRFSIFHNSKVFLSYKLKLFIEIQKYLRFSPAAL